MKVRVIYREVSKPPMLKNEPIIVLLAVLVVFFTFTLFLSEKMFPNDGQIFQVVSGLLTGFGGALLGRVKPAGAAVDPSTLPPGGTVTTSQTSTASVEKKD